MHPCDLKSAVSEHTKDAGHSIDEISVEIISQENHLMPLCKILGAIDITGNREQFCSPIKTRLRITANVTTDE